MTIVSEPQVFRRHGLALRQFAAGRRTELLVAALVFILNFSAIRLAAMSSNGGVETWLNLTNQMFYGRQDFLFSYGPLYWLVGGAAEPFSISAYWLTVVALSAVSACFWSMIVTLCYNARALLSFTLAFLLFFTNLTFPPLLYLWPFAFAVYLECRGDKPISLRPAGLLALGALVGAWFYVRYLYGVVALATFGPYFLSRLAITRRPSELLFFLAGVFAGYVVVGLAIFHSSSSILEYLAINNQLSFGNSVDMTLDVNNTIFTCIAVAAISAIITIYVFLGRKVLFLSVVAVLVLLIKLGFSRADHYINYFVLPVSALSLFLLLLQVRASRIGFLVVMGLLYGLAACPTFDGANTRKAFQTPFKFSAGYAERMRDLYQGFTLPHEILDAIGSSTVDVYPFQNEYMFANRLNYLHRPVFQDYMTLTPALDAMNQRFFEGSDRPKFVLWSGAGCGETCNQLVDVDGKMSLNEDPLTTSALLFNYHVVSRSRAANGAPLALLEENQTHSAYAQSTIGEADMTFGQWYPAPKNPTGVVKLAPRFSFTALGRAKNLLFRGGVMFVNYRLASGEVKRFRLNILNAQSGVWVSPYLSDLTLAGPEVVAIMFETSSSDYVKQTFHARWIGAPLTAVGAAAAAYDPVLQAPPAEGAPAQVKCEGYIDLANGASATPTIEATGALNIRGWLAFSTERNLLPDQTFLTLTDADGKRLFVKTHRVNRPDVGDYFHHPELSDAGYEANIDLSGLRGRFTLGVAGLRQSELFTCDQFAIPLDSGG